MLRQLAMQNDKHILVLGVTGSIAAYKACELTRLIKKAGWEVRVVETANAVKFVPPLTFETLSGKTFYDENPDALRLDKDQFINVWSIVIATILTIIGFAIQNENIIMLGLSSGVLVNSISYIVGYSRGHFPKAEKTRYFYPIIGLGGSIIPFVYNLLRILRIVPASFLGSDLTFALMFAWRNILFPLRKST